MNEDNLEVTLREATNGWIVEFNKFGETIESVSYTHLRAHET